MVSLVQLLVLRAGLQGGLPVSQPTRLVSYRTTHEPRIRLTLVSAFPGAADLPQVEILPKRPKA